MLYACLAVLLLVRKNFRLREGIVAAILYALSLGGYQSYLFTAATLSVMALILAVIQGETLRNLWKKFLRLLFSGGAGVILYLVLNKLALLRIHKSNVDDRGFSTMGQIDWKGLPWRIFLYVYHYNKEYFFGNELINNSYGIVPRRYLNLIFLMIAAAGILIYLVWGRDKLGRKLTACLMMVLIPFGTVSLYLCAPKLSILETTGSLAASAFFLVYVFVLSFADMLRKVVFTKSICITSWIGKAFRVAIMVASFLVLLMYVHMAQDGQAYLRYKMNQTKAVAQSVSTDILQAMREYGTNQVLVEGNPAQGNYDDRYSDLRDSVHWLVASYGVMWETSAAQTCFWNMCGDYIGFTYERPDAETCDKVRTTQEYAVIPCYPEKDSVRLIEGIIVVKLSDNEN